MKTQIFSFLVLIFLALNISAQTREAQKIEEFGNLECDDYLARMDNVQTERLSNPSSTIYVLVYEGKESKYNRSKKIVEKVFPTHGLAKVRIDSIKKYLLYRKLPTDRFKFVEAGFREDFTVEFWLVPIGAMPPKSSPTLTKMKYRKGKSYGFCIDCC